MGFRGDSWGLAQIGGDSWGFVEHSWSFVGHSWGFVALLALKICSSIEHSWGFVAFRGVSWGVRGVLF